MKQFNSLAIAIAFTAVFFAAASVPSANGQAAGKVATITSDVFTDEKGGIAKYLTVQKTIKAEFTPLQTELTNMQVRFSALTKEIEAAVKTGRVDPKKSDEAEKLQRDIKLKQEDAQARYNKRLDALLGPVNLEIGAGLEEFAKQKGYTIIFDRSRDQNGLLIFSVPGNDVTQQFIEFFNAKYPAAAR